VTIEHVSFSKTTESSPVVVDRDTQELKSHNLVTDWRFAAYTVIR